MPVILDQPPEIVVTAARVPEDAANSAASVTVIDRERIERLGEPLIAPLLRQIPSLAVASTGPAGAQTQVRIRGAEARHTLLFVDGIRANDPAAGNEPRFELLNADLASRIEVVRGPQSALWGSEAIGGVVAVDGAAPVAGRSLSAQAEAGSHDFLRGAAGAAAGSSTARLAIGAGYQRSDGINIVGGPGDRDGYRNVTVRARGEWQPSPVVTLGAAGFAVRARNEFDHDFPISDAPNRTRNRLAAGRLWVEAGTAGRDGWSGSLSASLLGSTNANRALFFDDRSEGQRRIVTAQLQRRLVVGPSRHLLVAAIESEREKFRYANPSSPGANQDRDRAHQSLTLQWRAEWGKPLVTDVAVRRDRFNRFRDATTLRASALLHVTPNVDLTMSYGEGIAQPSFFQLYGFFPDFFAGNPNLRPERSRSVEVSVRYRRDGLHASLTLYRDRLRDELKDVFAFPSTTVNAAETSRRKGVEIEAGWTAAPWLRLSGTYAYLDASEPDFAGTPVRETRRPRHSGSVTVDGAHRRLSYGASIAYTGARTDMDFTAFSLVRLKPYWLASARIAYSITPQLEGFVRVANAFDQRYADVVGYRTEGRTAYAGVRLAFGR